MTDRDADTMAVVCCACPSDATARHALADRFEEIGFPLAAETLRSGHGEECIRAAFALADQLKRKPDAFLVRCVAEVILPTNVADAERRRAARAKWEDVRRVLSPNDLRGQLVAMDDG